MIDWEHVARLLPPAPLVVMGHVCSDGHRCRHVWNEKWQTFVPTTLPAVTNKPRIRVKAGSERCPR